MAEVQFYKVNSLPADLCPNSWYIVISGDNAEAYVTTNNGIAKRVGNTDMIEEIISNYITAYSNMFVVPNITARNALSPTTTTLAYVIDASADSSVGSGSAAYIWSGATWYKISGGGVQSVTGLNTDNTDTKNPIVKISVDGTTITGDGTPTDPLVSNASVGPTGPAGATGSTGATGSQGTQGPQGISGSPGIAGQTGPQGQQGVQGVQGQTGPQGVQGLSAYQVWLLQGGIGDINIYLASLKGSKGDKGDTGSQGPTGSKGSRGDTGVQGTQGIQGLTGPQGIQGNDGEDGEQGIQGPTGPQGIQGIQGEQGEQGDTGSDGTSVQIKGSVATSSGLSGIVNPSISDGYITEDNGHLWVYNGASFVDVGEIRGPQGSTGPQGPTGSAGTAGTNGADGATGATGPTGPQGPSGVLNVNGEYSTQQDAIDGGLTAGQVYRLPYLNSNRHLAIVEEPMPDATFYFGDTTLPITVPDILGGQPGITPHNEAAEVNYTNVSDQYLWYAEPITEDIKDVWFNTVLNNGSIGAGELYLTPTIIGGLWRLYVTAYETTFTGSVQFRSSTPGAPNNTVYISGLNTDNTDPLNPIVKISVDGTSILGQGTPSDPLKANVQSDSGLYTANVLSLSNASVGSTADGSYSRVGNIVHLALMLNVEHLAPGTANLSFSIPVGLTNNGVFGTGVIVCDQNNNSGKLRFLSGEHVVTVQINSTLYGSMLNYYVQFDYSI